MHFNRLLTTNIRLSPFKTYPMISALRSVGFEGPTCSVVRVTIIVEAVSEEGLRIDDIMALLEGRIVDVFAPLEAGGCRRARGGVVFTPAGYRVLGWVDPVATIIVIFARSFIGPAVACKKATRDTNLRLYFVLRHL